MAFSQWIRSLFGGRESDQREFEITVDRGVAVVKVPDKPSTNEIKRAADEVVERGLARRRMYDFSGIAFPFTNEEVRDLAEYGSKIVREPNRVAILIDDDVGYGSGRVFGAFREDGHLSQTQVFHDRNEAMAWLTEEF